MLFCEEQHPACSWNKWTRRKPFPTYPGGGCSNSQAFNLACSIQALSVFPLTPNIPLQGKGKLTRESQAGRGIPKPGCVRLTVEAMTLEKENSFLHNGAKGVAQENKSRVGLLRKRLGAVFRLNIDHTLSGSRLHDPRIRSVSCQQAQQSTCLVGVVP